MQREVSPRTVVVILGGDDFRMHLPAGRSEFKTECGVAIDRSVTWMEYSIARLKHQPCMLCLADAKLID